MYVMEYGYTPEEGTWVRLHEMSRGQFALALRGAKEHQTFKMVSARVAHREVRRGTPHTTGLYLDDNGNVRRAKDLPPLRRVPG